MRHDQALQSTTWPAVKGATGVGTFRVWCQKRLSENTFPSNHPASNRMCRGLGAIVKDAPSLPDCSLYSSGETAMNRRRAPAAALVAVLCGAGLAHAVNVQQACTVQPCFSGVVAACGSCFPTTAAGVRTSPPTAICGCDAALRGARGRMTRSSLQPCPHTARSSV